MGKANKFKLLCLIVFLCSYSQFLFAQNIIVKGNVKDEKGETLPGVTIQVKGGKEGTITDFDGNYSISATANSTLIFSYIGYRAVEQPVNNNRVVNLVMEPDVNELDEVVVIAYGAQKKVTITGAVSNLSNKELLKSPSASLGNALSGKLPGVSTVQYSGMPGADDPSIYLRGVGSLNSSTPLILVDGVERSFTQIDPNEVADISILKDASATAVFGVRGANGVILITTKRGEVGKTSISVSTSYGVQMPTRFLEFANSYDYANYYNNAQLSDGVSPNELKYSPEAIQHFKDHDQPLLYPDIDWIDYILKDSAPQTQHNINISGGNEKALYFVSVGMLTQDGLFKTFNTDKNTNFNYKRYNYRANVDLNLTKLSTVSLTLGGRLQDRNDIGGGNDNLFRYLMDSTPMAGAGIVDGKRILSNPTYVGETGRDGLDTFYAKGYKKQVTNVLNLDLEYKLKLDFITRGLSFRVKGSYNSEYTKEKDRSSGGVPSYTPILLEDGTIGLQKSGDVWNLGYTENSWFGRDWYTEASFNYARSFGLHDFTGLLLYNQSKKYYPDNNNEIPTGYVGLVGRVTYNYASRYLADFNVGYNGSENFAPGKRYGFFPSVSVGWIVSGEDFMKNQNIVTYLKLRYSYGTVGNDNQWGQRFLYLPGAYGINGNSTSDRGSGSGYNFGTNNNTFLGYAYEQTAGNPNVTWETATKQNIGIDLKTLNDRLGINVDIFFENRKDILINNSSFLVKPSALKANSINYGKVKNHGYEITLNWNDRIGNDFRYSISPSMSFARNEITEQAEVRQNHPWLYRTGHPVGQPFGYEFFGFYEGEKTEKAYMAKYGVDKFPTQISSDLKPGDCVYVDLNEDGKIDGMDEHAIGFTNVPEYNFSLNASFSYKGFDFSMLWIGATNVSRSLGDIYRPQMGQQNKSALSQWVHDNTWTPETAGSARLPRMTFSNVKNNTANSSVWLVDASYLRLKNVEIGYNFTRIPYLKAISNLRVFANGYNLLTFSDFKGNDPENTGGGYNDFIKYPVTRVFNLGLRVNF